MKNLFTVNHADVESKQKYIVCTDNVYNVYKKSRENIHFETNNLSIERLSDIDAIYISNATRSITVAQVLANLDKIYDLLNR